MKTNSSALLLQLTNIAQHDLQTIEAFAGLPAENLAKNPAPEAWSALQCLEHLNLYAVFYLPEIEKALTNAGTARQQFSSGIIGNMLVNSIIPKENGKKMKTFAAMEPENLGDGQEVLNRFIANQRQLILFLQHAANADLNHRGVAVTFTSLIKLRLGDALRFMVHHHHRHILQAQRALGNTVKS
ncbi:DinB family protein [Flavobacterium akiainvivens]|uniref:DinB family protein n=1 Tax=Flavobacterium akiainvivens TaxID=1202724 RepID=UPI0006C85A20|nr:DinB family protein [Flavobacterium akiainvivens]SFQ42342.1 DinB superfamily protein [Flavobacterium akiainvivens]